MRLARQAAFVRLEKGFVILMRRTALAVDSVQRTICLGVEVALRTEVVEETNSFRRTAHMLAAIFLLTITVRGPSTVCDPGCAWT